MHAGTGPGPWAGTSDLEEYALARGKMGPEAKWSSPLKQERPPRGEAAFPLLLLKSIYSPRFQFIRSPSVVVEPEAAGAL
jgi:hypothetical protein